MCFDPYILERITASRLSELRADAARRLTVQSLRPQPSRLLAHLRLLLLGRLSIGRLFTGRTRALGRSAAKPRHA